MHYSSAVLQALACVILALCGSEDTVPFRPELAEAPTGGARLPEYRLGLQPISTPRNLWERYHPLIAAINASASGYTARIDSAMKQAVYEDKLRQGVFDFLLIEPHRVLQAEQLGYEIVARAGKRDRVSGVIVTGLSSPIHHVRDLRGKTICFGAGDSLASTMLPRMWFREMNFNERSANIVFSGSDHTALFRVWRGLADAAAISRANWERFVVDHPTASATLSVKWQTNSLSGAAFMAHKRLPPEHVRQIAAALTRLDQSAEGQTALAAAGMQGFQLGGAASYDDVWEFMTEYARTFQLQDRGVRR